MQARHNTLVLLVALAHIVPAHIATCTVWYIYLLLVALAMPETSKGKTGVYIVNIPHCRGNVKILNSITGV